jgi:hypothetical protein
MSKDIYLEDHTRLILATNLNQTSECHLLAIVLFVHVPNREGASDGQGHCEANNKAASPTQPGTLVTKTSNISLRKESHLACPMSPHNNTAQHVLLPLLHIPYLRT